MVGGSLLLPALQPTDDDDDEEEPFSNNLLLFICKKYMIHCSWRSLDQVQLSNNLKGVKD